MGRDVFSLAHKLGVVGLGRHKVEEHADFLRRLAGLECYPGCAAGYTRACSRATGVGYGDPVECVAYVFLQAVDLPRTRQHHRYPAVLELADRIRVAGAARATPNLFEHRAIFVPADEFADGGLVAVVHHQLALAVENLRTIADGRAGETVAGAVPGQCGRGLGGLGDLACGFHPLVPGCLGAGHGNLGLFEQGLVDIGAGHGELRHEAVDAFVGGRGAQPGQRGAEVGFPVGAVFHEGADVEVVLGQTAQVGYAGDVRTLAGGQLHRQLLHDSFVGHNVQYDFDAGVLRFELLSQLGRNVALDAVLVAHDADVGCAGAQR